jgi:alkylation response protein AidB-like acyl-CoA dehydrogenase
MLSYHPVTDDLQFALHDVRSINAPLGRDPVDPRLILAEAGTGAADILAPLNRVGDIEGCRLENGNVTTPTGFPEAFRAFNDGGWGAIDLDETYGGMGLPYLMHAAATEMFSAANMSFGMCLALTHGAFQTLRAVADDTAKQLYLPKLARGEWTGTMLLTEPQAGSDLGLIRTKAIPAGEDTYQISGEKIFISAGDHDMADNIVHLVLARLPDAPEGTRGISLFLVPKFIDADSTQPNGVTCTTVEDKMGLHGSATCALKLENATGVLLGQPNKGLRDMFRMMNEARLFVAIQGVGQIEIALQQASRYAEERIQGGTTLAIHPEIARSLDEMRYTAQGGRVLYLWASSLIDRAHGGDEDAARLVPLLTPILKAFLTDEAVRLTSDALQVFGGHGYIEETGMSQILRDTRVATIYEGTNGIQAIDLVQRKLGADDGAAIKWLLDEMERTSTLLPAPLSQELARSAAAVHTCVSTLPGLSTRERLRAAGDTLALLGQALLGMAWGWIYLAATSASEPHLEKRRLAQQVLPLTAIETERRLARVLLACGRSDQKNAE